MAWLEAARASDLEQWATTFAPRDEQQLHGEINVLRYLPLPVLVRAAAGTPAHELSRVLYAGATVGAEVEVSVAEESLVAVAREAGIPAEAIRVEDADAFADRLPVLTCSRIRLLGEPDPTLLAAHAQRIEIALFTGPVLASGRVELLTFLHEQAISATNHRYGNLLPHTLDLTGGRGWERGPA